MQSYVIRIDGRLEESKRDVLIASIESLSSYVPFVICSPRELQSIEEPFLYFGPSDEYRVVTDNIHAHMEDFIGSGKVIGVDKLYQSAFTRPEYFRPYKWKGIRDPLNTYNTSTVACMSPALDLGVISNEDLISMRSESSLLLMKSSFYSRTDFLSRELLDSFEMLNVAVRSRYDAAIIGFNPSFAVGEFIGDECLMTPYDILARFTTDRDVQKLASLSNSFEPLVRMKHLFRRT